MVVVPQQHGCTTVGHVGCTCREKPCLELCRPHRRGLRELLKAHAVFPVPDYNILCGQRADLLIWCWPGGSVANLHESRDCRGLSSFP